MLHILQSEPNLCVIKVKWADLLRDLLILRVCRNPLYNIIFCFNFLFCMILPVRCIIWLWFGGKCFLNICINSLSKVLHCFFPFLRNNNKKDYITLRFFFSDVRNFISEIRNMLFIDIQSYCKWILNKYGDILKKFNILTYFIWPFIVYKHSVKHNVKNANIVYWNSSDMIHIIQLGKKNIEMLSSKIQSV